MSTPSETMRSETKRKWICSPPPLEPADLSNYEGDEPNDESDDGYECEDNKDSHHNEVPLRTHLGLVSIGDRIFQKRHIAPICLKQKSNASPTRGMLPMSESSPMLTIILSRTSNGTRYRRPSISVEPVATMVRISPAPGTSPTSGSSPTRRFVPGMVMRSSRSQASVREVPPWRCRARVTGSSF